MRKAAGAGVFSEAPKATYAANLHLATYRIDTDYLEQYSTDALKHIFAYLAAAIAAGKCTSGRERDGFRWCCLPENTGLLDVRPVPIEPRQLVEREKQAKEEAENAPEDPVPVVSHSTLPGVKLMFDPDAEPSSGAIALQYLPEIERRLFYVNSLGNFHAAKKGRIDDPMVPVTLSIDERKEIDVIVDSFISYMKSDEKHFDRIASQMLFDDYKSKKWTAARAEKNLEQLRATYNPQYRFSGQIKLEPSKPGKPPRLLIADGDRGQVMAWATIGVFEKWLFCRFRKRSIKGAAKEVAMERLVDYINQRDPAAPDGVKGADAPRVPVAIVENDGSAWDACMSSDLRNMTENRVMDAVAKMLEKYFVLESNESFTSARLKSNRLVALKLELRPKPSKHMVHRDPVEAEIPHGKGIFETIRAIRRSGCRGTSCLNYLANMLCWIWVIGGKSAKSLVTPAGVKVTCVDGGVRWVRFVFEGDDSIVSFHCKGGDNMTEDFLNMMTARWAKLGHRPKLFWRKPGEVAEAVGWHFVVDDNGLMAETGAPDVLRQLINCPYAYTKAALEAAAAGDRAALGRAIAPGVLSRAYHCAYRFPLLARELFNLAHRLAPRTANLTFTMDDRVRLDLDFGHVLPHEWDEDVDSDERLLKIALTWEDMWERTETRINQQLVIMGPEEASMAVAHKIVPSEEDYYDMLDLLKIWDQVTDHESWTKEFDRCRNGRADVELELLD